MVHADRRIQRTKTAIYQAMFVLLAKKKYSQISVQDIIDEANIGRSTFYSHFETKDFLLQAMCNELLGGMQIDLEVKEDGTIYVPISKLMLHVKDNIRILRGLLQDECKETVSKILIKYWKDEFSNFYIFQNTEVSGEFLQNYIIGSIAHTIFWWYDEGMKQEPLKLEEEWNRVTAAICIGVM